MTPQFRDTIVAVLVLYFLIAFVGNLAEADTNKNGTIIWEPSSNQVAIDKDELADLFYMLCKKHTQYIGLKYKLKNPKTSKADLTAYDKETMRLCWKWVNAEYETRKLYRS